MQKVFLDTNIILDFLGEREGFYEAAAKVLTLADQKKNTPIYLCCFHNKYLLYLNQVPTSISIRKNQEI